jgi:hypothetical protein
MLLSAPPKGAKEVADPPAKSHPSVVLRRGSLTEASKGSRGMGLRQLSKGFRRRGNRMRKTALR